MSLAYLALAVNLAGANPEPLTLRPVVELFTSQSCSSCPPAEDNLRRLAERSDVIALERHVDYWNRLTVGAHGAWRDPYSSPAHTLRQRIYNSRIRPGRGIYTPQAVINGASETVGAQVQSINALIAGAADTRPAIVVDRQRHGDVIDFTFQTPQPIEVSLVRFAVNARTAVTAGENHGRKLDEAHIVIEDAELQAVAGDAEIATEAARYRVAAPAPGEDCAVLVKDPETGALFGGAYCRPRR